ncbi:transcription factor 24 isoform X1 [Passer domesticus]|uniref:transcription factor 24 isoform X1 n=1 Tax=Passer domesticus TaxID=48849 RepID=UPI0030FE1B81
MDCGRPAESSEELGSPGAEAEAAPPRSGGSSSAARSAGPAVGRPAAANAARERSRVQTLRHAFLELQRTLPSVPPDTKLSKLDVLLLATTYIAHLTRSLQDEEEPAGEGLGTLRGDGYLHPVKNPDSHLFPRPGHRQLVNYQPCVNYCHEGALLKHFSEVAHAFQAVHWSHGTVSDSLSTRRQHKPWGNINIFTDLTSLLALKKMVIYYTLYKYIFKLKNQYLQTNCNS